VFYWGFSFMKSGWALLVLPALKSKSRRFISLSEEAGTTFFSPFCFLWLSSPKLKSNPPAASFLLSPKSKSFRSSPPIFAACFYV